MRGMGRLAVVAATVVAVVVVLLLSHRFGRAEPTGDYRPELPPAALATGCFPLPGDVRLDFAHQVRSDDEEEVDGVERRILEGQYDLIDEGEAREAIVAAFVDAGFVPARRAASYDAVLTSPGRGSGREVVRLRVEQLPGIAADSIVRGTFVLDLPLAPTPSVASEVCADERSTKRFDTWWEQWQRP